MINDISFRKFAIISLSLFLAFNGSIGLDYMDIHIPLVREVSGFLFLTLIPGYMILRILRVHKIDRVEALLYAVGLSLFYVMITGFFMNMIYPLIGIERPISLKPFLVAFNVTYLLLLGLAYGRDKDHIISYNNENNSTTIPVKHVVLILAFLLILFSTILGTIVGAIYHKNTLLVVTLVIISFIPILVEYKKMSSHLYPYMLWIISLSLLYHYSLFSHSIVGTDIFSEYYFSKSVELHGVINYNSLPNAPLKTALSILILPNVYHFLLDLSLTDIFKLIYPLLFSFVALEFYSLYSIVFDVNDKTSNMLTFFSVFFMISVFSYYSVMPGVARQEIAELFFGMLLLVIFNSHLSKNKREILAIIFLFCIAISHYTWGVIMLYSLIIGEIVILVIKALKKNIVIGFVGIKLVTYLAVLEYLLYAYIGNGITLKTFFEHLNGIILGLLLRGNITLPYTTSSVGFLHIIYRGLYIFALLLIPIGFLYALLTTLSFNNLLPIRIRYLILSIPFMIFLGISLSPRVGVMGVGYVRGMHISSLLLAPYVILGLNLISLWLSRFLKRLIKHKMSVISLFLTIFIMFNSGVMFEILHDPYPNSVPLSLYSEQVNIMSRAYLRAKVPTYYEIFSAKWLFNHRAHELPIYATYYDLRVPALESYGMIYHTNVIEIKQNKLGSGYLFLGYTNTKYDILYISKDKQLHILSEVVGRLYTSDTIYSNNISKIHLM